jgi:cyclic pyranopterin monophosphate synthase
MSRLTHFDPAGQARMVDVGDKMETQRSATARGLVQLSPEAFRAVAEGKIGKGDVLGVARLAGIMGAKKTPELIPLCHPLPLTSVAVDFELIEAEHSVAISATCKTTGRTGVEMEAMTAVSVAALTVYDMVKAIDKAVVIREIRLVEKAGGKSGPFKAA